MYLARLNFDANIEESDIAMLAGGFEAISSAHSAVKPYNDASEPWLVQWVLDKEKTAQDLTVLLKDMAEIYGLSDILPQKMDWQIEKIEEDVDWLAHSYRQFPAFDVGPFYIYGSHHKGSAPSDKMGLQIDAATAFGSGEHGTTKGCLLAMLDLKDQGVCPWNILDMGTGSGILAVAAWKLWKTPVLAVDNDDEAVRVADRHRDLNGVPSGAADMRTLQSEGFADETVAEKGPYELIIANILAGPLKDMASDMYATTDDLGYIILSGILNEQAEDVLSVYTSLGLKMAQRYDIEEWSTLVLRKA